LPAEKRDLIELGWPIQREVINHIDVDGRKCRPSLYFLPDKEWCRRAKIAIKKWEREKGAVTPPSNTESAKNQQFSS